MDACRSGFIGTGRVQATEFLLEERMPALVETPDYLKSSPRWIMRRNWKDSVKPEAPREPCEWTSSSPDGVSRAVRAGTRSAETRQVHGALHRRIRHEPAPDVSGRAGSRR